MILRKPYGFLIKHFKIIHLILTAIYIYLAIKINSILKYYNNFISGTESKLNAIKLITNYYLIAIIASILICLIIYALMRYKKKPKLLYLILIILYILVAVVINIAYKGLDTIYISVLEIKTLRLYRDILKITIMLEYISISFTLIRGLGFDIKKFNFKEDILDLQLDLTDNEEVELTIGNTEGLLRKIRRHIRELKYYYKENKLFITIIIIITIVLTISIITLNKQVINKTYNENEIVNTDTISLNVTNTYITNYNYQNKYISNEKTSYIILKTYISPKTKDYIMNTANLNLKIGNNNYKIEQKKADNFSDLGTVYKNNKLSKPSYYIFVFIINNEDINKPMQLIYGSDKIINLNPVNIDKISNTKDYKLNDTIDLSKTIINNGTLKINSYEIKNKYSYSYTYEIDNKTYDSKINITSPKNTILYLNITKSLSRNISLYEFLTNYVKIKYILNEQEYTSKIMNNKTPGNYNEGVYLEVDKEIEGATKIYLEISIRNQLFKYTLK